MKKTFFTLAMVASTIAVNAQTRFGLEAGANFAKVASKSALGTVNDIKNTTGFTIGVNAEMPINNSLYIQSGLHLETKGYKTESSASGITAKDVVSPMYITLPINAVYKFELGSGNIFVNAGPYLGYGIGGKVKESYTGIPDTSYKIVWGSDKAKDDIKPFDLGLNIGAGYEMSNGLFLRAQYGLGLSNIEPGGDKDNYAKNRCISLSLGYWFGGNNNSGNRRR